MFKDRNTIGWIGYCPGLFSDEKLPGIHKFIPIKDRGAIIMATKEPFDAKNPQYQKIVGETDIRLLEMGLLPMYGE